MQIIYSDYLKGLELPVNTMIVVVVCLIVLLAIVALFFGTWNPGKGTLSLEAAKNNGCQILIAMNCNADSSSISVRDFDADRDGSLDGTGDTLKALCQNWYGISNTLIDFEDRCKSICMCQKGAGGTSGGSNPGGSTGPGGCSSLPCPTDCVPGCQGGCVAGHCTPG